MSVILLENFTMKQTKFSVLNSNVEIPNFSFFVSHLSSGPRIRVAPRELQRERQLRFRHPGAHRSWHQVRPLHRYLRHGLLRGAGQTRNERPTPETQDRPRRQAAPAGQGRRHEVVPDQIRRNHP